MKRWSKVAVRRITLPATTAPSSTTGSSFTLPTATSIGTPENGTSGTYAMSSPREPMLVTITDPKPSLGRPNRLKSRLRVLRRKLTRLSTGPTRKPGSMENVLRDFSSDLSLRARTSATFVSTTSTISAIESSSIPCTVVPDKSGFPVSGSVIATCKNTETV